MQLARRPPSARGGALPAMVRAPRRDISGDGVGSVGGGMPVVLTNARDPARFCGAGGMVEALRVLGAMDLPDLTDVSFLNDVLEK